MQPRMPEFEPTIPAGQPELMRASGFTRYLDELARDAPQGHGGEL